MMATRKFSAWLRDYREQQNMTQAELARVAGVGRSIISKIEGGQQQTSLETLSKIADALHLSQEYIYQQAGILDPAPKNTKYQTILISKFEKLTKREQKEVLDYIDYKLQLSRKRAAKNG